MPKFIRVLGTQAASEARGMTQLQFPAGADTPGGTAIRAILNATPGSKGHFSSEITSPAGVKTSESGPVGNGAVTTIAMSAADMPVGFGTVEVMVSGKLGDPNILGGGGPIITVDEGLGEGAAQIGWRGVVNGNGAFTVTVPFEVVETA